MTGTTYSIPPQPPIAANNHLFPAGALTFGVEYRELDPDSLRATYAGNEAQLAELEARSPEGGFFDNGVSIHVCGTGCEVDGPERRSSHVTDITRTRSLTNRSFEQERELPSRRTTPFKHEGALF